MGSGCPRIIGGRNDAFEFATRFMLVWNIDLVLVMSRGEHRDIRTGQDRKNIRLDQIRENLQNIDEQLERNRNEQM